MLFYLALSSLSAYIVTCVSRDLSTLQCKCNAAPGELLIKVTVSEEPYIWCWLCDANVKMYQFTSHALWLKCCEVIT